MPLKDIKTYIELLLQGDETIHQRLELFEKQRDVLLKQMEALKQTLDVIDYKCWFYKTAELAGTTSFVSNMSIEELPERFQETKRRLTGTDDNK